MRTFPYVWREHAQNVVAAAQPDPNYRTVFFKMGNSHCRANSLNVRFNIGFLQECEAQQKKNEEERARVFADPEFQKAFGPRIVTLEPELSCRSTPLLRDHPCCTHQILGQHDEPLWGMYQYARKQLLIADIKAYSKETRITFAYVVVVRPDLHFFEPIPPVSYLLSLPNDRMLISNKEHGDTIGDYVFLFPWSLADAFADIMFEVFASRCRNPNGPQDSNTPELTLNHKLHNPSGLHERLPYQVFPFVMAIVRTANKAECERLNHVFLGSGRYYLQNVTDKQGVVERVLTIMDHCRRRYPQAPVVRFN
jgi:hypothetical protein